MESFEASGFVLVAEGDDGREVWQQQVLVEVGDGFYAVVAGGIVHGYKVLAFAEIPRHPVGLEDKLGEDTLLFGFLGDGLEARAGICYGAGGRGDTYQDLGRRADGAVEKRSVACAEPCEHNQDLEA